MNPSRSAPPWRFLLILPALAISRLAAQDAPAVVLPDFVTTATRTPAALTTTGTAVDSINAAELSRMQLNNLGSVLAGIPGAPAAASGAPGGVTSLFLRGSNSNQTLFLVDGIRANDPNTDYQATLGGVCLG
ncbi:MAG: TonB-dependent receptor plug domain-containing protein, partial [Oleiharenicola lentus]